MCVLCSSNSSWNWDMISAAEQGREEGILINQGGQYLEIDPFMFSIAVDELFRLKKHSNSKQCKHHLWMCPSNSEMSAVFPHPEAQWDECAQEQQCWILYLHNPPEPVHLSQSTPEKLMLCHNASTISSCWVSFSLLLPCHLLALSSSARVTPPAFPSSSYFINSSLCISLLVYLLEVENTFTTSLSMKHSLRELPY